MGGLSTRDRYLITTKTQRNNNAEYPLDRSANPYARYNKIRVIVSCQYKCFLFRNVKYLFHLYVLLDILQSLALSEGRRYISVYLRPKKLLLDNIISK